MKSGETVRDYANALYDFMEELQLESVLTERMHRQAEAGRMQEAEGDRSTVGNSLRRAGSVRGDIGGRKAQRR